MRTATEQRFAAADGTELFYRRWPAVAGGGPRRAVVLFHRGHEHSGRLQEVVDGLDLPGRRPAPPSSWPTTTATSTPWC
ncbi:MAG TPA: hypothetical protein VFC23_20950 [Thermoanaerobaculia bacterium]|nr:hypothetical protein [Thermoanaerobaculia bacterium]